MQVPHLVYVKYSLELLQYAKKWNFAIRTIVNGEIRKDERGRNNTCLLTVILVVNNTSLSGQDQYSGLEEIKISRYGPIRNMTGAASTIGTTTKKSREIDGNDMSQ